MSSIEWLLMKHGTVVRKDFPDWHINPASSC